MEVHQAIFKMNLLKLTTPVSVLNLEQGVIRAQQIPLGLS